MKWVNPMRGFFSLRCHKDSCVIRVLRLALLCSIFFSIPLFTQPANAYIAPYVHYFNCNECHFDSMNYYDVAGTVCLKCHNPSWTGMELPSDPPTETDPNYPIDGNTNARFMAGDASNAAGNNPYKNYQTSHNWNAPTDTIPEVGAKAPVRNTENRFFYSRYGTSVGKITCSRCHLPHGYTDNPQLLVMGKGSMDKMCQACHQSWVLDDHGWLSHPIIDNYNAVVADHPDKYRATLSNVDEADIQLVNGGVSCTSCHGVHFVDSDCTTTDGTGQTINPSDGKILRGNGPEQSDRSSLCQTCHTYLEHGDNSGEKVGCMVCHSGHSYDPTSPNYYVLRKTATTTTFNTVNGLDYSSPDVLDEDLKYTFWNDRKDDLANGFCEKCHGDAKDIGLGAGSYHVTAAVCTDCHSHENSTFGHGDGSAGGSCDACHGHDAGYEYAPGEFSQGRGSFTSHSTHTEADSDDVKGPELTCDTCHDTDNFPEFKDGTDDLSETNVCDLCHSPLGTYDGVDDAVVGAKNNWDTGVYNGDALAEGKEKWCATCHDESSPEINGVYAPNVIGDERGSYTYGVGWGYYKTGHGLQAGENYPSKGGVETLSGRPVECDSCHDFSTAHVDGLTRTFDDGDSSDTDPSVYRLGYRLKLVDGEEPMQIPWKAGSQPNEPDTYKLCAECHNTRPFIGNSTSETNLITDGINRHYSHLVMANARWVPDWDGAYTSRLICVTCHNVHGSTQLAMVRDGKLIGREPGLVMWYYNEDTTLVNESNSEPPDPEDTPLSASDGTVWRGKTSINLCSHCHNNNNTIKEPRGPFQETSVAPTLDWTGENGYAADGANPDSGFSGSPFTFRVKYTDLNNDGPVDSGFINLLIDTDNDGVADETYLVEGADVGDEIYLNGKIYSKTLTLANTGSSVIGYKFEAQDGTGLDATGSPTNWSTVTLAGQINNRPQLAWVADDCRYKGVSPVSALSGTVFEFYVGYTDADDDPPASIEVWVDLNDDGDFDDTVDAKPEKQALAKVGSGSDYVTGESYNVSLALNHHGDGMLTYRFVASDGNDAAIGDPVSNQSVTVIDPGLTPITVCESPGPGCDYTSVQDAIDAARSGDKLTLAYGGNYTERLSLWESSYSNSIVRSVCGPDQTTIADSGNEVVFLQNVSGIVIDGFGITGASTGIRSNAGVATINNCKIHDNHSGGRGGGLSNANASGTLTITNSEIYNNSAVTDGGAIDLSAGTGHSVTNTIIRNNTASGGGGAVFTQNGSVTFTDVTIKDNTAAGSGGAVSSNGSDVNFVRSTITGNRATTGSSGVVALGNGSSDAYFENCIVADNQAAWGGVAFVNAGTFTAINSTFADNQATAGEGGILWNQNATSIFRNSILWGNSASNDGHNVYFNGGSVTVSDSILASGSDGVYTNAPYFTTSGAAHTLTVEGFMSESDPMFIDAAGSDYHAQIISPAVDNGNAAFAPSEDIDGDSRPQGNSDDIGADEYPAAKNAPVLSWTGETNYVLDGIDPDRGNEQSATFTFRVDYTDAINNSPPALAQVWIDEDDSGTYGADEKFIMTAVDPGDNDYADGKRYTLSRGLNYAGNGSLKFRFYATDGAIEATGDPTANQSVSLTNSIPVLSWTGETDYVSDGVNPDTGQGGVGFTFRVKYVDGDNIAPSPVQVWVDTDNSGTYDVQEKFDMTWVDDGGRNYTDGEKYTRTLHIPYTGNGLDPVNISYRFYATDGAAEATGDPVADIPMTIGIGPSENSAPSLSWSVAECLDNGVRPPVGDIEVPFEFKVLYTDLNGTGPEGNGIYKSECAVDILLLIDKDASGTYDSDEKYILTEADAGDGDCTNGKLYETTLDLGGAVAGELNYSFYATDSFEAATGEPTVDSIVTVYSDALKVRPFGGAGWLTTIQSAEDSSFDGATILVYPNNDFTAATYTENIEARTANLEIRSACGADLTIIDGGGSGVGALLRADNQVLDGFSVTNAGDGIYINPSPDNITIKNNKIYGNTQYGINVNPGFNIHIDNNEIYNNNSSGIRANGSTVEITDSDIHHNYAAWGGGIMFNGNIHTITDSVIRDNSGVDGGGMVFNVVDEGTTVTNTVISNNHVTGRGGGIYNTGGSQLILDKCTITGNQTTSAGGAIYSQSGWSTSALVRMSNSIAAGNSAAGKGGFVFHHSGLGEYYNNTFADNHSSSYGGVFGACTISQQLEVRNSVFQGNTAVDGTIGSRYMCNGNGPLIHVTDSYFSTDPALSNFSWGTVTSENNIDCCEDKYPADPDKPAGFIAFDVGPPGFTSDGNYHIQSDSPLIDRANAAYAPEDDIDENGRTVGLGGDGSPDMGADEYYAPADSTTAGYVTAYASDPANNTSIAVTMPYLGDADGDNTCTVDYKLSSAHTSVWTRWVTDVDCGTSPYSTTITGLAADEKYDVRTTFADPDGVDGKVQRTVSSVDLNWYVDLTEPTRSTAESAGAVTVTATLSRVSDQDVTVPFTVSGTATAETDDPVNYDHDLSDGSIIITAGDLTGEISFAVKDDVLDETSETVVITMGNPINALADRFNTQTITITDNDSPVLVDFTSTSETTVAESGTVVITVQLSEVSGMDVEVPFTVNVDSTALGVGESVDYSITDSPVVITAGSTSADITITVNTDSFDENDETVIVDMGTPIHATRGTTTTHTTTITDDDATPSVTFAGASQSVGELAETVTLTANLSAASGFEVTVPFTVGGTATSGGADHDLVSGNILITAGQTGGTTTFTVTDDEVVEGNETVIVTMGSPTNATVGAESVHTVTILDNDAVTFAHATQFTAGESGAATITVRLSSARDIDVIVPFTVNGTSTATGGGTDYSITSSPATIAAGSTTAEISVTITEDTDDEGAETVIVDMGNPTNAAQGSITTHALTITDDDSGGGPMVTVCASPAGNFTTIQSAINDSGTMDGTTVLVCEGAYNENINFGSKKISVVAEGAAANTIIQGTGSNTAVVTFNNSAVDETSILDGFTIDNQGSNSTDTRGVSISAGATPSIKNCIIENNQSYFRNGAGVYITGTDSGATFVDTIIRNNSTGTSGEMGGGINHAGTGALSISGGGIESNFAYKGGGGIYVSGGDLTITDGALIKSNTSTTGGSGGAGGVHYAGSGTLSITDSTIESNTTTKNAGGGLYLLSANANITGSTFKANTCSGDLGGGGIYLGGTAPSLSINSSLLVGNVANGFNGNSEGGALRMTAGTATITNSIISGNITGTAYWAEGGGLTVSGGTLSLVHSTVAGNWANRRGGGIYVAAGATVNINGSLMWDNDANDPSSDDLHAIGTATVDYSAIEIGTGYSGSSNVTSITGTVFVSPDPATSGNPTSGGDYHIKPDAIEIINSADPSSTITVDIDSDVRTGTTNDMGADEYMP